MLEEQLSPWDEVLWICADVDGSIETSSVWSGQIIHGCDFKIIPIVEEDEMNVYPFYWRTLALVDKIEGDNGSLWVKGGLSKVEGKTIAGSFDATEERYEDPFSG